MNSLFVPPVYLHNILVKVIHDMRTNSQLELPDDLGRNILAYVSIKKVTPMLMDDFLLGILI